MGVLYAGEAKHFVVHLHVPAAAPSSSSSSTEGGYYCDGLGACDRYYHHRHEQRLLAVGYSYRDHPSARVITVEGHGVFVQRSPSPAVLDGGRQAPVPVPSPVVLQHIVRPVGAAGSRRRRRPRRADHRRQSACCRRAAAQVGGVQSVPPVLGRRPRSDERPGEGGGRHGEQPQGRGGGLRLRLGFEPPDAARHQHRLAGEGGRRVPDAGDAARLGGGAEAAAVAGWNDGGDDERPARWQRRRRIRDGRVEAGGVVQG